ISHDNSTIQTITDIGDPVNVFTDKIGFIACNHNSLYRVENGGAHLIRTLINGPLLAQNNILVHPNYFTWLYSDSIYLANKVIHIPLIPREVLKYSPVSDSILSVNTVDGAYLLYLDGFRLVKVLPGIKVSNAYMDSEKNIWIGTLGEGLYKLSSRYFLSRKINENQNDIWYINKDK